MKNNKAISFIILILAIMTEYFHLLFLSDGKPIYHSQKLLENGTIRIYYLDDLVYFFTNELFTLFTIIVIAVKMWNAPASKSIMSGVVFWYFIEWLEITLQLVKINDSRLYINDGSWLQLFTCVTISVLILFGSKKQTS